MDAAEPIYCHRCAATLMPGEGNFYIVRIEAICDPTPPAIDRHQTTADFTMEWERLLDELRGLSARELLEQVHRRLTIHLCASCYRRWIEDPADPPAPSG